MAEKLQLMTQIERERKQTEVSYNNIFKSWAADTSI